ncbi:uncharacterized protein [Amphiura filiformis]|uniref:uncharacterized protein n=1 Tax=Amphiura filiformis TaxID=82378 RepID=UPI003B21348C
MRERDCLKKKAIKTGLSKDWSDFRSMKNRVNYEIKHSKKSYVANSIQTNSNNTKQVWNTIRQIIPGKSKGTSITCIKGENGNETEPKDLANIMNTFFANIGPDLAAKIPNACADGQLVNERMPHSSESFMFQPVSHQYVLSKLRSLPEGKATGTDDLPSKLIKMAAASIVEPIAYLINLSLESGIFPDAWKNARICPIYKGGDATDPEFMLMGSRQRLAVVKDHDINVNINGVKLRQVHNCKHLGVIVDDSMTWHDQLSWHYPLIQASYRVRRTTDSTISLPAQNLGLSARSLNRDLDKMSIWADRWMVTFEPSKCKAVTISRKRDPTKLDLLYGTTRLAEKEELEILGVTVDSKLTWTKHTSTVSSRA